VQQLPAAHEEVEIPVSKRHVVEIQRSNTATIFWLERLEAIEAKTWSESLFQVIDNPWSIWLESKIWSN
jgi:hypothetical protein